MNLCPVQRSLNDPKPLEVDIVDHPLGSLEFLISSAIGGEVDDQCALAIPFDFFV